MLKKLVIVIHHINMLKKKIHMINLTDARTKVLIFDNLLNTQEKCMGFPCGSAGKESACNVGRPGFDPWLGRTLEKGKATQSSTLAWRIPWTV